MRAIKITHDDIQPYLSRIENGQMTLSQLAKEIGVSITTLRKNLVRLGISTPLMRNKGLLAERIFDKFSRQELMSTPQSKIAREMNCTQASICRVLKELGIVRRHFVEEDREAKCAQVVDHIMENGGYVKPTLKKLGLRLWHGHVYDYCKERNIDLKPYRFAYRRYGHWLTLPGIAEPCYVQDYRLKAKCTKCGSIHKVQLTNLAAGLSTQCGDCAAEERRQLGTFRAVICLETNEKIRSIRSLAKRLGVNYQVLLSKLKKVGHFKYDELTYQLVD